MEYRINDFCDRECLWVATYQIDLVTVISGDHHMRFQADFTPAQARELANALNDCADTLEVIAERKREVAQEVEQ